MAEKEGQVAVDQDAVIPTRDELLKAPEPEQAAPEAEAEESGLTELEEQAYAQGWRPRNEFEGNKEDWRPAKDWLERGEMIAKIKRMGGELKDLKGQFTNLYQTHLQEVRQAYTQAITDLKAQRLAAMKEQDFDAVVEIEHQLDNVRTQAAAAVRQAPPAQNSNNAEVYQDWVAKNQWYVKDPELQAIADGYAVNYLRTHPNAPADELGEHVAQKVRKDFPQKFGRVRKSPPSPDGGSQSRDATGSSGSRKYADIEKSLSPQERQIMDTYVNKLGLMTKDEYLADYSNARSVS